MLRLIARVGYSRVRRAKCQQVIAYRDKSTKMKIINPYTEEISDFPETSISELESGFSRVSELARSWALRSVAERVALCRQVMAEISRRRDEFAVAISQDMGKPIRWCHIELDRAFAENEHLLNHAERWLSGVASSDNQTQQDPANRGHLRYDPLGVVAVISPWNFPVMIPLRGIIPALLAGNGIVFKPSELTLRSAKVLAELLVDVIPSCPIFTAYGDKDLGEAVTMLPVQLIVFTGSSATGKKIAKVAAEGLKRCVFELGGLDAAVVLADVDIEPTAKELVLRNTANSGQACSAVKRAIVDRKILPQLVAAMVKEEQQLVLGNPLDQRTDLGPLVSETQLNRVASYVNDAVSKGAKAAIGGGRPAGKGYFFSPTILVDVPHDAKLLTEEPFGPVLPVIPFDSIDEAVKLANATPYGLMASIFTKDRQLAGQLTGQLNAGTVCINCHLPGGPGTPFGGVKESGYGRIRTEEGLHEFVNVKWVRERPEA